MRKPLVIIVVGPTATGKSGYAINLAKQVQGEIISADSRQVYKGLNIGSGKITKKEMHGVPHYMLDVVPPSKVFSAHDFKKKAEPILKNILARSKTPIVVGGTGLYVDVLFGDMTLPKVPPNKSLRRELGKLSTESLFKKLQKMDPERAASIDAKNHVRLIRAIEIATKLGKVPKIEKKESPYQLLYIGLTADREVLRKKIEKRLRARLIQGMLTEVKRLHKNGVSWKRMHELGLEYRYCALYLQGKLTLLELEKQLADKIYQYAMRQLTWFKKNPKINWIEVK